MAEILVTASVIESQANELESMNNQFKSQVGNLESQEASLNGMWEGEANEAFHRAFINDKTQMDNFYNLMNQYINALRNIASKYRNAENVNTGIANARKY